MQLDSFKSLAHPGTATAIGPRATHLLRRAESGILRRRLSDGSLGVEVDEGIPAAPRRPAFEGDGNLHVISSSVAQEVLLEARRIGWTGAHLAWVEAAAAVEAEQMRAGGSAWVSRA